MHCTLLGPIFASLLAAAPFANGDDRAPVCSHQVAPTYPFSMRNLGFSGDVVVDFAVNPEGNVVGAFAVKSSNPAFNSAAVEAVLKWRFQPGLKDGKPVWVHMQVPMIFQVDNGNGRIGDWEFPKFGSKSLPPEFQYDTAPSPSWMGPPVYPFDLLKDRVKGTATVTFAIDPAGHTRSIKVIKATHPDFGASAAAMVRSWTFNPAKKQGSFCWCILTYEQDFDFLDRDSPPDASGNRLMKEIRKGSDGIERSASKLDHPLQPQYQEVPRIAEGKNAKSAGASALIEFVVDRFGQAELPRIVSASNPDFGWDAATSVSRWVFRPPTIKGQPTDVLVRIPVEYRPAADPGQPAAAAPTPPSGN